MNLVEGWDWWQVLFLVGSVVWLINKLARIEAKVENLTQMFKAYLKWVDAQKEAEATFEKYKPGKKSLGVTRRRQPLNR